MIDLGIVIVNWNTRGYLNRCLDTVFASEGGLSIQVVVVDNGSSDSSAEMVAACYPQVVLISGHEMLAIQPGIIWVCRRSTLRSWPGS
jgi:GT2 family glycosyltransferase